MKVSTKGRYGLRIMVELAINHGKGYIASKELAEMQDVSIKYLETIIGSLSKAGLIKTQRGAQGGHMLSKEPALYTAGEILAVLEGSLCPVDCSNCLKQDGCYTRKFWKTLQGAIDGVIYKVTLEELKNDALQITDLGMNI